MTPTDTAALTAAIEKLRPDFTTSASARRQHWRQGYDTALDDVLRALAALPSGISRTDATHGASLAGVGLSNGEVRPPCEEVPDTERCRETFPTRDGKGSRCILRCGHENHAMRFAPLAKSPAMNDLKAKLAEIHRIADSQSEWYDRLVETRSRIRMLARECLDLVLFAELASAPSAGTTCATCDCERMKAELRALRSGLEDAQTRLATVLGAWPAPTSAERPANE